MSFVYASPPRYVQGRGVIDDVDEHLPHRDATAALIADAFVLDLIGERVREALAQRSVDVREMEFEGECTWAEVERLRDAASGCDVLVGAGGGKAIDAAKAVRDGLDVDLVSVPTIAATDAPASSISVVYTSAGEVDELVFHDVHPDLVLVDTEVVARAPTRFLRSGIADAMATHFEAETAVDGHATNVFDGRATQAAQAIAERCFDVVTTHGEAALHAVERDAVTESVEAVVEAAVLLSGLGFESGGLAAAHAVHDGLTVLDETHHATHGEKVNVGTCTQLVLEGREAALDEHIDRSLALGLPVTLADLGVTDPSDADLQAVADAACAPEETIHNEPFEVTPAAVRDAIKAADERGRARKNTR